MNSIKNQESLNITKSSAFIRFLKLKNNKNNFSGKERNKNKILLLLITVFILVLIFFIIVTYTKIMKNIFYKVIKDKKYSYNKEHKKSSKNKNYKKYFNNILPRLDLNNQTIPSLEEIFNSRILYIPDANLTGEYIRYLRPINETEEKKYQKRYSENETKFLQIILRKE